jgi:hypothetical protein
MTMTTARIMTNTATARIWLLAALAGAFACDVAPLTRAQLFGAGPAAEPDAGAGADAMDAPAADAADADAAPPADAGDADAEPTPACAPGGGFLSGGVVDACDPAVWLSANVGIAGQHTCSFPDKGSFTLRGLPVGCRLTLTAAKPGYEPWRKVVVIPHEGLAGEVIRLERVGGCAGPAPPAVACRCDVPGCVTP